MSLKEENGLLKEEIQKARSDVDWWRNRYQSEFSRYQKLSAKYNSLVKEISRPDSYHDDEEAVG